ncbi:MAG TPA: hypothetical protein VFZ00_25480 [Solirubrobacter sp.]|nr:hypothetical protein [Solirubrobacter sp.]
MIRTRAGGEYPDMNTQQPQPKLPQVVAAALRPGRTAHDRQRDLVRASLLCR